MKNESSAMREMHAIRLKLYEETKNMSPEERAEYARREVEETTEKLGLHLRRPISSSSGAGKR